MSSKHDITSFKEFENYQISKKCIDEKEVQVVNFQFRNRHFPTLTVIDKF